MNRKLSSSQTFLAKFIIGGAFLVAAAAVVLLFIVVPLLTDWSFGWTHTLIPLLIANVLAYVSLTTYLPLKVVSIEGTNLRISNFSRDILIPLSQVQHVEEVKQFKLNVIVLTLNRPTEFGRSIMFLPQAQLRLWKEHSVVGELKRLMDRCQEF